MCNLVIQPPDNKLKSLLINAGIEENSKMGYSLRIFKLKDVLSCTVTNTNNQLLIHTAILNSKRVDKKILELLKTLKTQNTTIGVNSEILDL